MNPARWIRSWRRPAYAYAHCDIPCGIYDPHLAQVAAHTVLRMDQLIAELGSNKADETTKRQLLSRYTATKEQHAELCKHELRVLWGDYFKPEHAQDHPSLQDSIWKALKLASTARQTVDLNAAQELLDATNQIAEIFWKTKGVSTRTVAAPYPTNEKLVLPTWK
jgi:nickel superoxide dismutase